MDGTISFSSIPGSYSGNSVDGTCDFTGVDTSSATSIGVSICDLAGHCTNGALTSVTVDSTGPDASTASPVGGTYKSSQSVTITPPADAVATYYTLNGDAPDDTSTLVTGSVTIDLVSHTSVTLKAVSYDVTGNEGTVMEEHYTYDANGSAGDKMKSAVLAGDITLQGSDPNNTSKITFVHDFTLTNGDADVLFPAGTEMTKTGGGSMDMSQMTLDDITNSLKQAYIGNIAGALSVGIPNLKLSFSKNIEVTIPVGDSYNGQTLNIYYLNAGESDWTSSTFCNVSGGLCVFQTNHATK